MYHSQEYYTKKPYTNLTDKAYDILEEMIVTLELKPGQTYSEIELSNLIGIGRTPVREAIKRLEATHTLAIIPRSGIQIAPVRLEECFLQMEVRTMLEKLVAVRAAKFSLPDERKNFAKLAQDYAEATERKDSLAAVRIDNEFNHSTANCARNIFAKTALMPLHTMARRLYYMQYTVDEKLTKQINDAHISVMCAIASGNEQSALLETENLISYIRLLSISAMDSLVTTNDFFKDLK